MTTNLWATLSDLKIHVFIGCAGSLLLHGFFSGCSKRELLSSCSVQASLLLHCTDFSLWWLLLWSIGSRVLGLQWLQLKGSVVAVHSLWSTGSIVVAHGLSCSAACGVLPDQGSIPCPLDRQVDSSPVR